MAGKRTNGSTHPFGDESSGDNVVDIGDAGEVIDLGDNIGIPTVNPQDLTPRADENDGGKRRRGRPAGSKNSAGKQATKEVAADLTGLLMSAHMMLAALTKVEEFELDKDEAERLSLAVARVNAEYNMKVFDPKTQAWLNLMMVGGSVYGPRFFAHKLRMKNEAKEKHEAAQPQRIM